MRNVFLCPGQGSQFAGMGTSLAARYPVAARRIAEADQALGWSLSGFMANGPEEELKRTDRTQPALYVASVAAIDVLRERGVQPAFAAGHSIGEYAALYAAGVFDFITGLKLVAVRSLAMHEASERFPGGMAALLGLDLEAAAAVCAEVRAETQGEISVANMNAPGQVVVSGDLASLERAGALARERGAAKVVPLPVAGAWHSQLMKSAEAGMAAALAAASLQPPAFPVVANVTAEPYSSAAEIRDLLVRQICGTVRWSDAVGRLIALGAERFLETGAGSVLTGLMKRIDRKAVAAKAGTAEEIESIAD